MTAVSSSCSGNFSRPIIYQSRNPRRGSFIPLYSKQILNTFRLTTKLSVKNFYFLDLCRRKQSVGERFFELNCKTIIVIESRTATPIVHSIFIAILRMRFSQKSFQRRLKLGQASSILYIPGANTLSVGGRR